MRRLDRRTALRAGAALAATALLLTACGDADGDGDEAGGARSEMVFATGSTGGTYFPLGGGMAEIWSNNIDGLRVTTQASGASVDNIVLLSTGEVELMMAVNGVAVDAIEGSGAFDGEEHDFVALGNVYPEVLQIVARADAGIDSIEDLAGKRVAIGPPGSGTELAARQILDYYGMDADQDIESFSDTFGDAADRLRDGTVDAAFAILALPAGSIIEVATSVDLVIVDITGPDLDRLIADDPSYTPLEVPADTYPGQEEVAYTVTNWATLYAQRGLDEQQVYDIVRVLYEHTDDIGTDVARQISIDTALDGLGPIELHPGAARYYEEQGVELP